MRSIQNRYPHMPKEALVLSLMTVLAVCAAGVLAAAPVHAQGGEPRSGRTVSVGL